MPESAPRLLPARFARLALPKVYRYTDTIGSTGFSGWYNTVVSWERVLRHWKRDGVGVE
jgi:hypothetical protein